MQQQIKETKLTINLLVLIAMLLAFVLIMVFLWQWYDLKNSSLEQKPATTEHIIK